MIASGSASISRTTAKAKEPISDSHLICGDCSSAISVDDAFCQECGVTLQATEVGVRSKLLALRDLDYAASAKRFAMLIGVVTAILLSVFAVMAIAGSYDAMSEDYICDHAKKLLAENDSVQAAESLQRLYLARGVKLKPQTQELLAQALLKRSELYSGRNQIELAIKDLKDVPPNSTQSAIAAQKLAAMALPAVPAVSAIEPVKVVSPEPVAPKTKAAPVEIKAPAIVQEQPSVKPSSAASDDDAANYNRLLTAYFEKAGAATEPSVESDGADEAVKEKKPTGEPPTLKEWVKAGRPDF